MQFGELQKLLTIIKRNPQLVKLIDNRGFAVDIDGEHYYFSYEMQHWSIEFTNNVNVIVLDTDDSFKNKYLDELQKIVTDYSLNKLTKSLTDYDNLSNRISAGGSAL